MKANAETRVAVRSVENIFLDDTGVMRGDERREKDEGQENRRWAAGRENKDGEEGREKALSSLGLPTPEQPELAGTRLSRVPSDCGVSISPPVLLVLFISKIIRYAERNFIIRQNITLLLSIIYSCPHTTPTSSSCFVYRVCLSVGTGTKEPGYTHPVCLTGVGVCLGPATATRSSMGT